MVKALIEGRKTQTRRTKGLKAINENPNWEYNKVYGHLVTGPQIFYFIDKQTGAMKPIKPEAYVGDVFWVRETSAPVTIGYAYKADGCYTENNTVFKWKPSIFMPKDACRIFLEVTNIRVQKLKDISDNDAEKEGVYFHSMPLSDTGDFCFYPKNYSISKKEADGWPYFKEGEGKESFLSLWESIYGKGSLESNPWIFAYNFKKIDKPENFLI